VQGAPVPLAAGPSAASRAAVAALLTRPLDMDAAVQVALLNNPGLHAALARWACQRRGPRAGRPAGQSASLAGAHGGGRQGRDRACAGFQPDGLADAALARTQWAGQQTELARLQAAQDVVRLAADTRKAWIMAVAAQQSAAYMRDVKDAAEAGAELARRMARVGNLSRLNQAREQSFLAEATAQLARSEQWRGQP
jgi:multidrug efflux system outer membrane protein